MIPKNFSFRIGCVGLLALLLVAVFGLMFFYKLGSYPLADYDEAIYAQVARQSFENGNQLEFKWLGNIGLGRAEQWFEKPPLMIWLTEAADYFFGANEFAARFWAVLFALGTIALTYFFARELFGSELAGFAAVAGYFFSAQFLSSSSLLQFDIPVGFFILLTFYAFWKARSDSRFYYLMFLALGLGVMTKSVIGLVPVPVIFLFSLFSWDFGYLKARHFYWGILLFLGLVVPWHVVESVRFGQAFWEQYLFYHLFQRFSTAIENNGHPKRYYWDMLRTQTVLFYACVPAFIFCAVQALKRKKEHLLVFLSAVFIFLFFSFSKTKLPAYILVLYPYLTLTLGAGAGAIYTALPPKWARHASALAVFAFIIFTASSRGNYALLLKSGNVQNLADNKNVGLFLAKNHLQLPVYNFSSTGTLPSAIFYSNRLIYHLDPSSQPPSGRSLIISETQPNYGGLKEVFRTPTQKIYELD